MEKFISRIDVWLEKSELRFGRGSVALVIGLVFLIASALTTALRFEPAHHGRGFTLLSEHPFNFSDTNNLRFRILSPLLGYLFFLRGELFKYFMLFVVVSFLGLVYYFFRRDKFRPIESIAFTSLAAFSSLVFHQLYFPAYNDPLSYVLIMLFMINYRNSLQSFVLLMLLLFNHENTITLFPFFFLLCLDKDYSWKHLSKNSAVFILALIPYWGYREFILAHQPVEYKVSYYFDPGNMQWTKDHVLPNLARGIFQAFRLIWLFPLIAIGINLMERRFSEIVLILLVSACVFSQFFVAYDISRLAALAFPAVLIGAVRVQKKAGKEKFRMLVAAILLLNFFIPSEYIGALEPIPLKPFWW